ncbi:MAG: thioredoxin family protein [Candidatus Omnitrophica bacterium]|nr:thioredoxin family protein [Candidatus Omnitrophota bacterium]
MRKTGALLIVSLLVFSLLVAISGEVVARPEGGAYSDYSEESFEQAKGVKRVLYFFAPWCPSCIAGDKKLKNVSIPEGVAVFKVDYDFSTELKSKYGVVRQHTFVQVDDQGEKIALWYGTAGSLSENIQ